MVLDQEYIKELMSRRGFINDEQSAELKKVINEKMPNLPKLKSYECLLLLYLNEEKTKGGIILPDSIKDSDKINSSCGMLIKTGELAYNDETRFPNGAWAKIGDWVLFPRGEISARIMIDSKVFLLVNDDRAKTIVDNPEDYSASAIKVNM